MPADHESWTFLREDGTELPPRDHPISVVHQIRIKANLDVVRTGKSFEGENMVYEDERVSVAIRAKIFQLPKHRVAASFEDISEKKRAEEERRNLERQVQQASSEEARCPDQRGDTRGERAQPDGEALDARFGGGRRVSADAHGTEPRSLRAMQQRRARLL